MEEDDENLSEDSEDDLVNFFDNDSDSELSDSIMDSEDRPSQNDSKVLNKEDATKSSVNGEISPQTGGYWLADILSLVCGTLVLGFITSFQADLYFFLAFSLLISLAWSVEAKKLFLLSISH